MDTDSTANYTKDKQRAIEQVVVHMIKGFIDNGAIDPEGKTREHILAEVLKITSDPSFDNFQPTIDHTEDLLRQARLFRKSNKEELSCLFYALWLEHKINDFVSTLARNSGLTNKEIDALVRESSYRAKSSWLLRLLGVKPFNEPHMKTISQIMEFRNAFVHYKWKPINEQSEKEIVAVLSHVEKTVQYFQYYERKYLARISKTQLVNFLK